MTASETPGSVNDGGLFRDQLMAAGLLVATGTDGIYGRSSVYEDIVAALEGLVGGVAASEGTASFRFPPIMPRRCWSSPAICPHSPT